MLDVLLLASASALPAMIFDVSQEQRRCRQSAAPNETRICGNRLAMTVNGQPGTMLIDPGGGAKPVCNADFAARAGLVRSGRIRQRFGSSESELAEATGELALGERLARQKIGWGAGRIVAEGDCVMGPAGLDAKLVVFDLGPSRATAQIATFRLERDPLGIQSSAAAPHVEARVGGLKMRVRFELLPTRAPTLLTAPAALALAPSLGATLSGPVVTTELWYDLPRPVRRLEGRRPLTLGPLELRHVFVRLADYNDASGINATDARDFEEGDLIVTARKTDPDGARVVRIGRDDLSRCVSIAFDKQGRQVLLTC